MSGFRVPRHSALLAVAVAAACGAEPQEIQVHPPRILGPELASYAPTLFDDSARLVIVSAALLRRDTLAVADQSGRVVLFDLQMKYVRSFGRKGAGPGELLQPTSLTMQNGVWGVADRGNSRLTWFPPDGAERSHRLPAMRGQDVSVTSAGATIVPKRSSTHYAVRIEPDGAETPWAPRSWPPARDVSIHPTFTGFEKDHVALVKGDTLIVVDGDSLVLRKYSPEGRFVEQRQLPQGLRRVLLRDSGSKLEQFGGARTVRYNPAIRTVSTTSEGLIVIGFPFREDLAGTFALLVNTAVWSGVPVAATPRQWAHSAVREAYVLTADRDRLVVASHSGEIGMYSLTASGKN